MSLSKSRFLFSSLKNRSVEPLNLLGRLGPLKRFHTSSHMRSARHTNNPLLPETTRTSHAWRSYLIPAAGLAGFGGLVLFLHYNDERRAIPKAQSSRKKGKTKEKKYIVVDDMSLFSRVMVEFCVADRFSQEVKFERSAIQGPIIGGPFTLIDMEGQTVTEGNLLGNWVLLYFGYTSSPDVGPAEVQKMAKAVDILESKQGIKILPTFVTIDPQRDTPSQLRAYLKELDPRILGLTGSVSAIRQMAQEYRVFFRKVDEEGGDYLVESSHNMYLVSPKMQVVRCFGVEYSAEELSEAIAKEHRKS